MQFIFSLRKLESKMTLYLFGFILLLQYSQHHHTLVYVWKENHVPWHCVILVGLKMPQILYHWEGRGENGDLSMKDNSLQFRGLQSMIVVVLTLSATTQSCWSAMASYFQSLIAFFILFWTCFDANGFLYRSWWKMEIHMYLEEGRARQHTHTHSSNEKIFILVLRPEPWRFGGDFAPIEAEAGAIFKSLASEFRHWHHF